jgi:hypothetical protein
LILTALHIRTHTITTKMILRNKYSLEKGSTLETVDACVEGPLSKARVSS